MADIAVVGSLNAILRACDIVQERFHGALVVKLGRRGCLIRRADESLFLDAIPVTPVDTIAAGDVFNAASAVSIVEGEALDAACAFALSSAALSVKKRGAQSSAPTRTELSAFIAAPMSDCSAAEARTSP
jgi:ribokinase